MTIAWLIIWLLSHTPAFPVTSNPWVIGFVACFAIDLLRIGRSTLS